MIRTVHFGLYSIGVGVAVLATGFAAWWVTGSVALYSDALESIINVVAACTATLALNVSSRPADPGHPDGHGKAEYLSEMLEGVLIILAALSILREAHGGLLDPHPVEAPLLGVLINAAASAMNVIWATVLVRSGRTLFPRRHRQWQAPVHRRPDLRRHPGGLRPGVPNRLALAGCGSRGACRPEHPVERLRLGPGVRRRPDGRCARPGDAEALPRHHLGPCSRRDRGT